MHAIDTRTAMPAYSRGVRDRRVVRFMPAPKRRTVDIIARFYFRDDASLYRIEGREEAGRPVEKPDDI